MPAGLESSVSQYVSGPRLARSMLSLLRPEVYSKRSEWAPAYIPRPTARRRSSGAIEQLMAAKSKEGLHQLFVQHTHSNCPK